MTDWKTETFKVHNHGHVRVVDFMGDDDAVVQAARVSYGKGTKTLNEDRGLIRYLMRHRHTTPFEMCVIKFHLKMPIFVARQWVRHRTASMNEYSARYSEMPDEFYSPTADEIKRQSKSNKQGSEGEMSEEDRKQFSYNTLVQARNSFELYQKELDRGVSREMARINLPLSVYTEFYWEMNLHNLLHFCALRSDPHAQEQIRVYSDIILHEIIKQWTPHTYEAFMDYVFNAKTFSAQEIELIKQIIFLNNLTDVTMQEGYLKEKGLSKREGIEFCKKLNINFMGDKK